MLYRSDMLKEIERALKDAAYADVRNIYMLLVGAGLIEEEEDELRTRIKYADQKEKEQGQATSEENG